MNSGTDIGGKVCETPEETARKDASTQAGPAPVGSGSRSASSSRVRTGQRDPVKAMTYDGEYYASVPVFTGQWLLRETQGRHNFEVWPGSYLIVANKDGDTGMERREVIEVLQCLIQLSNGRPALKGKKFLSVAAIADTHPQLRTNLHTAATLVDTEGFCVIPLGSIHGSAEVFYDQGSYSVWQRRWKQPTRRLCLQSLRIVDETASLIPIEMTRKRAADSQLFGGDVGALPSDKGYLDCQGLEEFYAMAVSKAVFRRMTDVSGYRTHGSSCALSMPVQVFSRLIEPLGKVEKRASHIHVRANDFRLLRPALFRNWPELADNFKENGRLGLTFPYKDFQLGGSVDRGNPLKTRGKVTSPFDFRYSWKAPVPQLLITFSYDVEIPTIHNGEWCHYPRCGRFPARAEDEIFDEQPQHEQAVCDS